MELGGIRRRTLGLPQPQADLSFGHEKYLPCVALAGAGVGRSWLQVILGEPGLYPRQRLGAERLSELALGQEQFLFNARPFKLDEHRIAPNLKTPDHYVARR